MSADPRTLRRQLRARRRALGPGRQHAAARRLARTVAASPLFLQARRLALYLAADGEIDPAPLARLAWARGKQVFLPVLHPLWQDRLLFVAWRPGDRLARNRYGIPEPAALAGQVAPWQLDLVLLPLVGFDAAGNRLGMGGGYYDRTFARRLDWPRKPRLCGLAHRCQQVERLPVRPWDVPLERVFTD